MNATRLRERTTGSKRQDSPRNVMRLDSYVNAVLTLNAVQPRPFTVQPSKSISTTDERGTEQLHGRSLDIAVSAAFTWCPIWVQSRLETSLQSIWLGSIELLRTNLLELPAVKTGRSGQARSEKSTNYCRSCCQPLLRTGTCPRIRPG